MGSAILAKAKKFLVNRVLDQAKEDGVFLDQVEIQMLGFAEGTASAGDMETAQVFERDYDDKVYEFKIAELLRRAYKRDKECGMKAAWEEALTGLADEDMYIRVMLQSAGISSSDSLLDRFGWMMLLWSMLLGFLPSCTAAAVGIVIAFTPIGKRFVSNELLRLALFFFLLVAPLLIAKMGRKKAE